MMYPGFHTNLPILRSNDARFVSYVNTEAPFNDAEVFILIGMEVQWRFCGSEFEEAWVLEVKYDFRFELFGRVLEVMRSDGAVKAVGYS